MENVKLNFIHVIVDADGEVSRLLSEPGQDEAKAVEDGDITVIRFLSFSDAAKEMSGKQGRVEVMVVEQDEDDEDKFEILWDEK